MATKLLCSDDLLMDLNKLLESIGEYLEITCLEHLYEISEVMRKMSEKLFLVRSGEILNAWIREEVPKHEQLWDVLLTDTLRSIHMILSHKVISDLPKKKYLFWTLGEDLSHVLGAKAARDLHKAVSTIYSFVECYTISLSFRACFDLKSFSAKPVKKCIRGLRRTISDPYSRARPEIRAIRFMNSVHKRMRHAKLRGDDYEIPNDVLADIQAVLNKAWEAIITGSASGSCHTGELNTALGFISVTMYTQLSIKLGRGLNSAEDANLFSVKYGVPHWACILETMLEILQQGSCQLLQWKDKSEVLRNQLKFLKYFLKCPPVEFIANRKWRDVSITTKVTISKQAKPLFLSCYYGNNDNKLWEEANNLMTHTIETISTFERQTFSHLSRTNYEFGSLDYYLEKMEILMSLSMISSFRNVKNRHIAKALEEIKSLNASIHRITDSTEEYETLKSLCNQIGHVACAMGYIFQPLLDESCPVPHLTLWFSDLEMTLSLSRKKSLRFLKIIYLPTKTTYVTRASNYESSHEDDTMIDEEIVGFVEEETNVVEHIVGGSKGIATVLIAGMPGLGKTTIAKKVYNNQTVVDHFDVRSWCCVSEVYHRKGLLVQILKHVKPFEKGMDEDGLAEILRRELMQRRYLIVMDDIWDITAWNDLRRCFPDDRNGSRILFTSRFNDISLQYTKIHFLNPLSNDESWELLQKKLRLTENCPAEFLEIGDRIAKGCKGVPLVVVLVAGLLADKNLDKWQKVASNVTSYVVNDSQRQCAETLEMSYKNLPYYLKRCFLYLGCFPPDFEISFAKLIQLWIAEGFINRRTPNNVECIAEGYLMDLVKRNLIEVVERRTLGGIKTCRVHDLIHDFCSSKGKEYMFVDRITKAAGAESEQSLRLGVIYDWGKDSADWSSYLNVHSLLFYSKIQTDSARYIFENFKLLTVLDLITPWTWGNMRLPNDAIGLLVHLRFLAGKFNAVPSNIVNLANLVTFRTGNSYSRFSPKPEIHLPFNFYSLARFRHLHIDAATVFMEQYSVPVYLFSSLQTLSTLLFPAHGGTTLTSFPNLRKLKCLFDCVKDRLTYPEFSLLTQLESLEMVFQYDLFYEPPTLCFTKWEFNFPPSIRKLTLETFCLPWSEISIIKELPNLAVLKLNQSAFKGKEWNVGDVIFPKLKYLRLQGLDINIWIASRHNLPRLENLVVQRCKYLELIPADFVDMLTLRMIEVSDCNSYVEASAREIREEQVQYGNEELKVLARDNGPILKNLVVQGCKFLEEIPGDFEDMFTL